MKRGIIASGSRMLNGFKASEVELSENLLILRFAKPNRDPFSLVLEGIIGFKDSGLIGKVLSELRVEDKGSYKVMTLTRPKGIVGFTCSFMEGNTV